MRLSTLIVHIPRVERTVARRWFQPSAHPPAPTSSARPSAARPVRTGGRSWRRAAGAVGLAASLLAAGAAPAGGADRDPLRRPAYSACVGPALAPAGFEDARGSFAEDAVNCLFHFGITKGRTADEFDLDSPVRRWEMALFLARASEAAGISLPLRGGVQFDDIGGLFPEARAAVDQMVELRVMFGAGGGSFDPDRPVTRAEMASILEGFLRQAMVGPGGEDVSEVAVSDDADGGGVFSDLGGVTLGEYTAINRMFEMGVVHGRSDGKYSPEGSVTRGQTAVFITRALAHTAARPAGVTIQAAPGSAADGSVELAVSVRDRRQLPAPYALVDVFAARDARSAFRAGGSCAAGQVEAVDGGARPCVIEASDLRTGSAGDLTIDYYPEQTRTVWAWSGDAGDVYDEDEHRAGSVRTAAVGSADRLRVTDDLHSNVRYTRYVRFGQRVTFTFQLVDSRGNPVAVKDTEISISVMEIVETRSAAAVVEASEMKPHRTDASGRVVLSYLKTDPTPGSNRLGDRAEVILNVTALPDGLDLDDRTTFGKVGVSAGSNTEPSAVWQDSAGGASLPLVLTQEVSYHEASSEGQGAAARITAFLTDLYGQPDHGEWISFTSDDPDGIGETPMRRRTDRRGQAHLNYYRDSGESGAETITAVSGGRTAEIVHYWVEAPGGGAAPFSGRLLEKDLNNNRLVIEGEGDWADALLLVSYDSNDQFTGLDGPATMTRFERDLVNTGRENPPRTTVDRVQVNSYSPSSGGVSQFILLPPAGDNGN